MVKTIRRFSDGFSSFRGQYRNGSVPNSRYGASFSSSVSHGSTGISSPDRRRSMASTSSSTTRRKVSLPAHLSGGYTPIVNIVTESSSTSYDIPEDDVKNKSCASSTANATNQDPPGKYVKVTSDADELLQPQGPTFQMPESGLGPRQAEVPIQRRFTVDVVEDSASARNNSSFLNPGGSGGGFRGGLMSDQLSASNTNLGLKNSLNPGSMLSVGSSLRSGAMGGGSMLSIFSSGLEPQADAVVSIMNKLGEAESLPLLNFLPWFLVEENDSTRNLNQTARANLIAMLISRLIEKVSARIRLVIMLDNAQWLDAFSLETLLALVKTGQKPFVILFARPTSDVHVSEFSSTTSLTMKGLTEVDVEEMIKQQYGSLVTSVDPVITKTIFKKCGGHPFFSLQLIQALKDFGKDHIAVTSNRRLAIMSKNLDLDHLLVNDVQTAIMAQFDRLNPDFQRMLKAASIMGQYFDLEDLAGVLDDGGDISVEHLENTIMSHDKHGFLAKVNDEDLTGVKDEDTSKSYGFKNILILSSISGSMPVSQKQLLHGRIAQYFESTLNEENVNILLPTISFHYSNSTNLPKSIDYLEELGVFQKDNRLFSESAQTIEFLLNILYRSSERDIREQFPTGPPTIDRKALWLSLLAESRCYLRQTDEALRRLKSALVMLGSPWPTSMSKVKWAMLKRSLKYWFIIPRYPRHGNGSRNMPQIPLSRAAIIFKIMRTMTQSLEWEGTLLEGGLASAIMLGLAVESQSETDLVEAVMKMAIWYRRRGFVILSNRYLKGGLRLKESIPNFQERLIVGDLSAVLYYSGQIDICLQTCRRFYDAYQDTDPSYQSAGYMAALLLQKGEFHESRAVFLAHCEKILASEDPFAQVLINDNITFADGTRDWFAISAEKLLGTYSYLSYGVLTSIAIHYLHHKEWSKGLAALGKISKCCLSPVSHVIESALLLCFYICVMLTEKDIVLTNADREHVIKALETISDILSKSLKSPIHVLEPIAQSLLSSTTLVAQGHLAQASVYLQKHLGRSQHLLRDRPYLACLYYSLMIKFRPVSGPKAGADFAYSIKSETQALLSSLGLQQIQLWFDS
ncbi:hypothetical protein HDU67_008426 [Dinochytrium kinnereticum]|nr:hypothetical protein HDU67_008426 [Dinochytrium kinnereticum]